MKQKNISPAILMALKTALSKIYWYKNDLHSFVVFSLDNKSIASRINWNDNSKYESASQLIDLLSSRPDLYLEDLISLIRAVIELNDFSHFDKFEITDSARKKEDAISSVKSLRNHCKGFFENMHDDNASQKAREAFNLQLKRTKDYNNRIEDFKLQYYAISKIDNAQERGYKLEAFLYDLFTFFDLSPRSSFRTNDEQIDGAFTHENNDYLLEAKWTQKPIQRREVDAFAAVVSRKLKTTLGLFFSVNGFVDSVLSASIGSESIILMDSQDLIQVLENRISLNELILLKRRHASETGENMYRVNC